jgi:hypothetical protein
VITQGTDAHHHLPAAVAGEIYRDLNHRFGTPVDMQVASTLDDEEKDAAAADAAAAENGDPNVTGETVDPNQAAVATGTPAPAASQSPAPQSKVKRVLMPIEKRPTQSQKNDASQPGTASQLPAGTGSQVEQRPRRTQPGQP